MICLIIVSSIAATIAAGIYWMFWIEEPAEFERMRKIKKEIY